MERSYTSVSKPIVVCLCGSTRFSKAFAEARLQEAKEGKIVLSIGCDTKSDTQLLEEGKITADDLETFRVLHLRQIDLADEVLILNVGGYIGQSTMDELMYAKEHNKRIRFLEAYELIEAKPVTR